MSTTCQHRPSRGRRCCCSQAEFSRTHPSKPETHLRSSRCQSIAFLLHRSAALLALCCGHCFALLLITRCSLKAEITVTFAGRQDPQAGDRHRNNLRISEKAVLRNVSSSALSEPLGLLETLVSPSEAGGQRPRCDGCWCLVPPPRRALPPGDRVPLSFCRPTLPQSQSAGSEQRLLSAPPFSKG